MRYKGIIKVEFYLDEPYDPAYMHPAEEYLSKLAEGIWEKDEYNEDYVVGVTYELEKSADAGTSSGQ